MRCWLCRASLHRKRCASRVRVRAQRGPRSYILYMYVYMYIIVHTCNIYNGGKRRAGRGTPRPGHNGHEGALFLAAAVSILFLFISIPTSTLVLRLLRSDAFVLLNFRTMSRFSEVCASMGSSFLDCCDRSWAIALCARL